MKTWIIRDSKNTNEMTSYPYIMKSHARGDQGWNWAHTIKEATHFTSFADACEFLILVASTTSGEHWRNDMKIVAVR